MSVGVPEKGRLAHCRENAQDIRGRCPTRFNVPMTQPRHSSPRARPAARPIRATPPASGAADATAVATLLALAQATPWSAPVNTLAPRLQRLRDGAPLDLAVAQDGSARVHRTDAQRVAQFLATLGTADLPCSIDWRKESAEDAPTWLRLHVLHRHGTARQRMVSGYLVDISASKKLEFELLAISEREQNRIGQDLHDDLCQVLAGLSCLTRVLENRLAPQLPHEVDNLREINRQLVDAMDRTRALTHGLYPAKMRSGDVRPALLELAKQVEVRFGVKVRTTFRGRFPAHTAHEILQAYRIAQEAISNAIRHGRADRIALGLESTPRGMRLRIEDNGCGFPTTEKTTPGIGLQIMQHRADQIGARIEIGNGARRGALIVLHYQPLPQP